MWHLAFEVSYMIYFRAVYIAVGIVAQEIMVCPHPYLFFKHIGAGRADAFQEFYMIAA